MQDATKAPVGLQLDGTGFLNPRVRAPGRAGPCWPTALRRGNLPLPATTNRLTGRSAKVRSRLVGKIHNGRYIVIRHFVRGSVSGNMTRLEKQSSKNNPPGIHFVEEEFSMTEVARPLYRVCLMVVFAAAVLTSGCSKKPGISGTPPPATAAPSSPTITLSADPTSINKGDSSTLHWSSTNATQLTIAPDVGAVAP